MLSETMWVLINFSEQFEIEKRLRVIAPGYSGKINK